MHLALGHGEVEALQDFLAVDFGAQVFDFEHSVSYRSSPSGPQRQRQGPSVFFQEIQINSAVAAATATSAGRRASRPAAPDSSIVIIPASKATNAMVSSQPCQVQGVAP